MLIIEYQRIMCDYRLPRFETLKKLHFKDIQEKCIVFWAFILIFNE